ncbi:Protein of unknown function DUF4586 [Carpediemonas membranifera]|uniref:Uncharacterized protein n=1 Tax=Carpediemonas membranifera TaxID=201153 RepID=A0A8J6BAY9_9EUKA|nr:Protein of unknown function DUF4586 [Carpediemonas membranifera]|eukprot:KAG9396944.1 Protein of unknown function DUF4586 [Carpediemonas membranifera]
MVLHDGAFGPALYVHMGEKYKDPKAMPFRTSSTGKNFSNSRPRSSYFGPLNSLAPGDKWEQKKKKQDKNFLAGDIKYAPSPKKSSGLGSAYGAFNPPPTYFSPKAKPVKQERLGKNFGCPRPFTAVDGSSFQTSYPVHKTDDYDAPLKVARRDKHARDKAALGGPIGCPAPGKNFDDNPYREVKVKSRRAKTAPKARPIAGTFKTTMTVRSGREGNFTPVPKYSSEKFQGPAALGLRPQPKNKPVLHTMNPVYSAPVRKINYDV